MHIRLIIRNYLFHGITMGGRRRLTRPAIGRAGSRHVGRSARQIRWVANPEVPKLGRSRPTLVTPRCREKPLRSGMGTRTANRHRWARRKSSGASENTRLGTRQIGPVTSEEGVLRPRHPACPEKREGVAIKRLRRLFTKNTG